MRIGEKRMDLSISQKLTLTFVAIVIIPLSVSFYLALETSNNLVIDQITSETMDSLYMAKNSLDNLLRNMSSLALYVNEDSGIKDLIMQEALDLSGNSGIDEKTLSLHKLDRIKKYNGFFSNIAFNMLGVRSYITVTTEAGGYYTNWAYTGILPRIHHEWHGAETGGIWALFEDNYVQYDIKRYPHVLTVGKNIIYPTDNKARGFFTISIPESEISALLAAGDPERTRVILDENNIILSSTRKEWLGASFASLYEFDFSGSDGYAVLDSGNLILSYITRENWKIVDIRPYDVVTRQMDGIRNRLLQFNALFMLLFIAISAFIVRGIVKPIFRLAQMMRESDFESAVPRTGSARRNEIGVLEDSFYEMKHNIKTLMHNNIEAERKKRAAELKALQAQISPHFLFNTLNTIRWAAINKHNKKAADMVLALSKLLRMTIVKDNELITVEEEIDNLRNYIALFQMRSDTDLSLICTIDDRLLQYEIPKLLLQPLVENSIIHGFEGAESGCVIEINGDFGQDFAYLRVIDNGVSIQQPLSEKRAKELKFSGIGLNNVNERIKLYFGEQYGLEISTGKGTTVEIRIPIEKEGVDIDKCYHR